MVLFLMSVSVTEKKVFCICQSLLVPVYAKKEKKEKKKHGYFVFFFLHLVNSKFDISINQTHLPQDFLSLFGSKHTQPIS